MIKLAILVRDEIYRIGIKHILNENNDIRIVCESDDYDEISNKLAQGICDVLLVETKLPRKRGIDLIRHIHLEQEKINILAIAEDAVEEEIFRTLKSGAKGYITKDISPKEFIKAIIGTYENHEYFSEPVSNIILKSYVKKIKSGDEISEKKPRDLTRREIQILKLVCEGLTNQQIADGLYISIRTVDTHKNHIMQKLKLKTTADLIKFAIKNGYVQL